MRDEPSSASNSDMRYENDLALEIPSDELDGRGDSTSIDRDGERRSSPPMGAALSVLWWVEDEAIAAR